MIWPRVNVQSPCPICQRPDWCCIGDFAVKCMRVESSKSCPSGGWYHFFEEGVVLKPKWTPPVINRNSLPREKIENLLTGWGRKTLPGQTKRLSESLGVSESSLTALKAVYSEQHRAWAFPMKSGSDEVVGIRLRSNAGFKWTVTNTRNGIFVPNFHELAKPDVLYLPEGPTSTAAMLSMGLCAVGRPNNMSGADQVRELCFNMGIYRVVIVADNDDLKKLGPKDGYPGIEGAKSFRKNLGMKSVIFVPPCKDVREFHKNGGTAKYIASDCSAKVWKKE